MIIHTNQRIIFKQILLWMWLLLWLHQLWLPSLPVSFRDAWLNSLIARYVKKLFFSSYCLMKRDWCSVCRQLQLTSSICHSPSSTYRFSEVTLAFFSFNSTRHPLPLLLSGGNTGHLAHAQEGWCQSTIKNVSVLGTEKQAEGHFSAESCDLSGMQEGAEHIASTCTDGTVQTPRLQRAPCCHREPPCPL